jgi:hypothetical protein
MGTRSQPKDQHAGTRVAEAWNGAPPVGFIPIGSTFCLSDPLAIGTQARALLARDDFLMDLKKIYRKPGSKSASHSISILNDCTAGDVRVGGSLLLVVWLVEGMKANESNPTVPGGKAAFKIVSASAGSPV